MTLTRQEIFSKGKNHLITQNQKSVDEDEGCCYRGLNGLQCLVGCFIPDDKYSSDLEGYSVVNGTKTLNHKLIKALEGIVDVTDFHFLNELQKIHDYNRVSEWKDELKKFAFKYDLSYDGI